MKRVVHLIICIPLIINAQEKGIIFEKQLSWELIQQKAKIENKYIFLDCYATWCKPCKVMDKEVYSNDKIGDFFNGKFVSLKLQMDTSKNDDGFKKSWYSDAHKIMQEHKVSMAPTFLFFSPDGKIVHKSHGFKDSSELLSLAINAMNSNKQFYTLLQKYQQGIKNYSELPYLIKTAQFLNEGEYAKEIAIDYLHNYLYKLDKDSLYTRNNIQLIVENIKSSKDVGFNLFYPASKKVDQIFYKGYSQRVVDYFITKEEILPYLYDFKSKPFTDSPNWKKIGRSIDKKYNKDYSHRTVLNAKINFYKKINNWKEYLKLAIRQISESGVDTTIFSDYVNVNQIAWDVFWYSNDQSQLRAASNWMKVLLKDKYSEYPPFLDTYANLLYKLGEKEEGVVVESKASELDPGDTYIQESLKKMKTNQPTWPVKKY